MSATITMQEFEIMVKELTAGGNTRPEMLCHLAAKILKAPVRSWCCGELSVAKGHEEDILQEITATLLIETLEGFLMREGVGGPLNMDPDGFKSWMFRVAKNAAIDYVKTNFKPVVDVEDETFENFMGTADIDEMVSVEKRETLSAAFAIVLESDSAVYKVLTWIAMSLIILCFDATKIESNELIIVFFEKRTLFQMRDSLFGLCSRIRWLSISDYQKNNVEKALKKPYKDGKRVLGEVEYNELFMKKGGKATISDWVNRMNDLIRREMTA